MTSEVEITATTGICYAGSIDELDARLEGGWRGMRFDGPLQAEYDRETARSRVRAFRILALIALGLTPFAIWMDASMSPAVRDAGVMMRLGFLLPVQLLGYMLLRERAPVWAQGAAFIVPNVAGSMTAAAIGMMVGGELGDQYIGMAAGLPFVLNIMASPRPSEALLYTLLTLLGVALVCHSSVFAPPKGLRPVFEGTILSNALGLAWVMRAELLKRRSFLHELKARIRGEELVIANRRLEALSNTDALTGIANRRRFDDTLDRAWVEAIDQHEPLSVLMIDADRFKAFNDALGHSAGDECLRRIAHAVETAAGPAGGLVARFGGEEFAVILAGLSVRDAAEVAEDIRAEVQDLGIAHPHGKFGYVTISIGVAACVPQHFDTPGLLINAADAALYLAKAQGRNRVVIADPASLAPPAPAPRLRYSLSKRD